MRVILRENIENLGKKGDIVNVAPGFGRNYLIPKKIAIEVTSRNKKMIEIEQKALQKGFEKEKATYQELIDRLKEVTLSFTRKTSEKDVIFGSVSSTDIRDSLVAMGFEVEKKKILLDEPIKRLGNYTVPIKIFHEERAEVKLEVVREGEPAVQEDFELSQEPVEEGAAASESVEEKDVLPVPEEIIEDVTAPTEEEIQDKSVETEEEPKPVPATAEEEISVEEDAVSEKTEESPEAATETPEETETIPTEEEKPEVIVETEIAEDEKERAEDPSLEETQEAPLETHEEPLEKPESEVGESPDEVDSTTSELEGKADKTDSQEAKSKDNK
jgi:large subunit ribosomal protein L9